MRTDLDQVCQKTFTIYEKIMDRETAIDFQMEEIIMDRSLEGSEYINYDELRDEKYREFEQYVRDMNKKNIFRL